MEEHLQFLEKIDNLQNNGSSAEQQDAYNILISRTNQVLGFSNEVFLRAFGLLGRPNTYFGDCRRKFFETVMSDG